MNKVYLLMAIHFHQPEGNFDFVFSKVFSNSYRPFIDTLKDFPDIKFTFHFSGCLLEWLQLNKPKFLQDVKRLVKSGQVEIMTGGFYEPILPVLPPNDAKAQITMLSDFIRQYFHYEPKGAWVAERVWEPNMPSVLSQAGIKYVILDDAHFKYAGLSQGQLYGYHITEDNGRTTAVFASDKRLRYSIPFSQPGQVIDYLRSISGIADGLAAVYGDDAEKFGEWPDTHEWVYEKKWLYNFLLSLRQNNSWIKTAHLSDYLAGNEPLGRVYLPAASYQEMGLWALPSDMSEGMESLMSEAKDAGRQEEFAPFLRGGFWRNFLTKYPESNQMYSMMIRVSKKIREAETILPWPNISAGQGNQSTACPGQKAWQARETRKKLQEARLELYKGQCNCAYWHGVFGGLYLYHLRSAVWSHLIKADSIIEKLIKPKKGWLGCEIGDFDSDGYEEAILDNSTASIFFDADEGGSITEFDLKDKAINIVNTLSRRKEPYHKRLLAQSGQGNEGARTIHERVFENIGLAKKIFYDWYRRSLLLDHFLGPNTDINNFSRCQYEELGDFVNQPFIIKQAKGGIILTRDGHAAGKDLRLVKEVYLEKQSADMRVLYRITNSSEQELGLWFGSEFNFSLTDDDVFEQLFREKQIELKDPIAGLVIAVSFSQASDIWRFPVKTVSQSESDIEENYQSTAILPHWKFRLAPGCCWGIEILLAF